MLNDLILILRSIKKNLGVFLYTVTTHSIIVLLILSSYTLLYITFIGHSIGPAST